ncbi:MAG: hypothetical protein JSY10_29555 [Paenibacillus sp.]|nr:hypothetical protein [Paenibacillus sp.]
MSYIYTATEYEKFLKEKHAQDWQSRWENLGELLSIAKKAHEATVELHEYEKYHDKSDVDDTTLVEPVYSDEDGSGEDSEVLDLTSVGPE